MGLNLANTNAAIQSAITKAQSLDIAVCIAVCDAGGRLISFARMDSSNWASIYGCQGKALTAAATRCPSGAIPPESVVMRRIAEQEGGNMIYARGGLPILLNGELLGAVGVGGASADLDEACAQAAVDAAIADYCGR